MKVVLLSLALLAPALPGQAAGSFFGYLHQTAEMGEAESRLILGLVYRDGWEGAVQPGSTAAKWREMAAELDDLRPLLVLGLLQRQRDRVIPDPARAVQCLAQAAAQGDNYARVILGDMLLEGNGVPVDWRAGTEWIRASARTGFAPAQFRLGILYLVGGASTPRNDVESLAWFIVAAEAGSKSARELRDERTRSLGREIARLAVIRSRELPDRDGKNAAAVAVADVVGS